MMSIPDTDPSSPTQSARTLDQAMASGWRLRGQSRHVEAKRICRQVLTVRPGFGEAWHLLGVLALDQGDHVKAVAHLRQAIAVDPHQPLHHNNLGVVFNEMRQFDKASVSLQQALKIDPGYIDAMCNLGLCFFHTDQLSRAANQFERILATHPEHDAALANLGMTRLAQQRYGEAAAIYEKAIAIDGTRPRWYGNLGAAYMRMNRFDQAAQCYRRALAYDAACLDDHVHLGIALRAAGDLPGSVDVLEAALKMDPLHSKALAELVVVLEYTCQWDKLESLYPLLDRATRAALSCGRAPDEDPMLSIRRSADIEKNQAVARAWGREIKARSRRILPPFSHERSHNDHQRITVGYLSYDFRNHPVAHQLYPLFGMHDRSRFRVLAFSMGPDNDDMFHRRIQAGCDEFIDIAASGAGQCAQAIRDRGVDILVDLMGHSHHNRLEILCMRPAPVQVGYLGFLSSSGLDDIDYVVADNIVVPPEHSRFYSERVVRMPDCYQMNHAMLMDGSVGQHRKDWGLPEDAFVFCSFNNAYKIDARLFDAWMRILARSPNSVLWLYAVHSLAREQMKLRAKNQGIDLRRLIFAEKIALPTHLNRLKLADLALDTIRYNGGATTANALGAGLPVITVLGRHWVSRMSASQLTAVGLPDLIFNDLDAYETAAVNLSRNPDRLHAVKQRLSGNLETYPLFDPKRFVRHLEKGYELIWDRHLQGLETCDMDIPQVK